MFILVAAIFGISTVLFKKAAGTLNPGKFNIISYIYYIFMLQSFIGISLVMLGYDEHYTFAYLINREKSCHIAAIVIWGMAVCFPLFILFFQKIVRFNIKTEYAYYLKRKVETKRNRFFEWGFSFVTLFCILLLIGFLLKIGYVPIWKLLFASGDFNFALERTRIGQMYFIHPYVTNICILSLIPLLSYISYSYFLTVRTKQWAVISGILFIASIIIKTYKFEKSPVVFYLLVFILIYIYFKGGIKTIYMIAVGIFLGGLLIISYSQTGFAGNILDVYNGPLGRTIFTEVGTLTYCFDLFPHIFGFLGGRSFTPTILKLLGMDESLHLRSAKVTMAFYGSERVYDGSAGVMNTLFTGEAYANWGYIGVCLSVVWVAFIAMLFMYIILKLKKTPSMIALLGVLTVKMGTMLEGGFCDFVYSFDIIFSFFVILVIYICFEKNGKIGKFILEQWTKMEGRVQKCIIQSRRK
ncbi:O-antigen polymerase [Mediterraneibacter massiliensis]|uniref:O-antigen polymerase n=1 Tax=Mediterraneibacter massiliensis TaxID=1720300 RepID=UPI0024ADDC42|nr:O-antigen polymerase [Mediterraneibacter massiliensis]